MDESSAHTTANVVRMTLTGQYRAALLTDIILQRQHDPGRWQDQAIADLGVLRHG